MKTFGERLAKNKIPKCIEIIIHGLEPKNTIKLETSCK